jgi:hypothetical protein
MVSSLSKSARGKALSSARKACVILMGTDSKEEIRPAGLRGRGGGGVETGGGGGGGVIRPLTSATPV